MDSSELHVPGTKDQAELAPLLVSARSAAALCGKSLRTWRTWVVVRLRTLPNKPDIVSRRTGSPQQLHVS